MSTAILGQKIGMTRVFDDAGTAIPVTIVQAGPCPVLQVKTNDRDGYEAIQIGYGKKKPAHCTRPETAHARPAKITPPKYVREIRLTAASDKNVGDVITVEQFEEQGVKFVDVVGTSIGKGFQGVMKRHNFGGQPGSHGTERKHRSAGGIGAGGNRGWGRCIKKGKRMAGHMGHERCTARNQKLVSIDKERNLLLIKGAVPGPRGGFVIVSKAKTKG